MTKFPPATSPELEPIRLHSHGVTWPVDFTIRVSSEGSIVMVMAHAYYNEIFPMKREDAARMVEALQSAIEQTSGAKGVAFELGPNSTTHGSAGLRGD